MTTKPGINTELLDGNLTPQVTLSSDVVLIIDRAYAGPSNQIYPVSDFSLAANLYGESSPAIQLARHAIAGGSQNVALYRIGGKPAEIRNIFGEYSSLRTSAESLNAHQNLSVYIGPRPNDPTKSCIIVWRGTRIVYSSVPSMAINTGEVIVDGFDFATQSYRVGSISAPVAFSEVVDNLLESITETYVATAAQGNFTFSSPVPTATANISVVKVSGGVTTLLSPTTGYTTTIVGSNVTGISLVSPALLDDDITVLYAKPSDALDLVANEIAFSLGEDNMSSNLNKLYELYDQAFEDLDLVTVDSIVLPDLFNTRNIGAGDDITKDRNTFVYRKLSEVGFEYEWSVDKYLYQSAANPLLTVTDPLQAAADDNGQPIIVKEFNEVDFAHRLATWCQKISTQTNFVKGFIGVQGPASTYTHAVSRWIGKEPVLNASGEIIQNGTGLLGNRFMAGTVGREGGFYATASGYPDGTPLYDSQGAIVDIGKFLSICVTPIILTPTTPKNISRSCAGVYAGMVRNVVPGNSTTNALVPVGRALFDIKVNTAEKLSTYGYLVLINKSKGLTVFSGDLATRPESDYDYISTAISVAEVLKRLERVTDPFIGRGIDQTMTAALWNAVETELKFVTAAGIVNGYSFNILKTAPHKFIIPLSLISKEELRVVNYIVSLQADETVIDR